MVEVVVVEVVAVLLLVLFLMSNSSAVGVAYTAAQCQGSIIIYMSRDSMYGMSNRSGYRKYLPGQFIRIRLKIEQNCRLFLDIFSSAIMNDLSMTFTSRLKVDAKCANQQ